VKLIAKHQVVYAPGSAAMPGEVFEVADDSAARLIEAGAAEAVAVSTKAVAAPPPAGKRTRVVAADADTDL
jgi:hypothetical protein